MMAGTHGDLISEIGKLVVAAHAGEPIDLTATSEELAWRYAHLGVPPDSMARAIARSLSAVSVSVALMGEAARARDNENGFPGGQPGEAANAAKDRDSMEERAKAAGALFPSGVRLAPVS